MYDSLTVTGTTNLSNSSFFNVNVVNPTQVLIPGNTFTVLNESTVPTTLPQKVISNSSPAFVFSPSIVGNSIVLTVAPVPLISILVNPTPSVQNLAVAVNTIMQTPSLANTPLVKQLLEPLLLLPTAVDITNALNQMIYNQNEATYITSTTAVFTGQMAMRQLFAFLGKTFSEIETKKKISRTNKTNVDPYNLPPKNVVQRKTTGLTINSENLIPTGYMAGDSLTPNLRYGVTFYGSREKERVRIPGDYPFNSNTGGVAFIVQKQATDEYMPGLGFSYATSSIRNFNLGAGSVDPTRIQSYQLTFLNTYMLPEQMMCFELDLSFAQNKVHQVNHIFFGVPVAQGGGGIVDFTINGDYYSKQTNLQFVASKNLAVTSLDLCFIPTFTLTYNHFNRAAYMDNNPNPAAMFHSRMRLTSVIYGVGFSVSKDQRNDIGETVAIYESHVMNYRDMNSRETTETDQFVGGGPTFIALGIKPFRNTINVGGSISMPAWMPLSITAAYDLYVKHKYHNHAITLKVNWVY